MSQFLFLLARICLGATFLWSGVGKIYFYESVESTLVLSELPPFPYMAMGWAVLEILGSLCVIFGWRFRFGSILLLLLLLPTMYFFFSSAFLSGSSRELHAILFFKNLAVCGGLLYAMQSGPGRFAVGRR